MLERHYLVSSVWMPQVKIEPVCMVLLERIQFILKIFSEDQFWAS